MKSMTGYALTEKQIEQGFISLEIKSYNARYLDIFINLPLWLSSLEPYFKSVISSKIARGKIEVFLKVKNLEVGVNISPNPEIASAYIQAMRNIAEKENIPVNIDLTRLIDKEGILTIEKNIDLEYWQKILIPILDTTIEKYNQSRVIEGESLKKDILSNLRKIIVAVETIKNYIPKMEEYFSNNIKEKIKEFLKTDIDENRVMQELALMMVKYTINEEIVRLETHCKSLENELNSQLPIGKKIDFICQEINREINTIGSKNQMVELSELIIGVKDALENIREQARNIE